MLNRPSSCRYSCHNELHQAHPCWRPGLHAPSSCVTSRCVQERSPCDCTMMSTSFSYVGLHRLHCCDYAHRTHQPSRGYVQQHIFLHNSLKNGARAGICLLRSAGLPVDLSICSLVYGADAQCASNGIQLNSACGQFTSAIKANAATILSSTCSDLQTRLQDPQYGTPSAAYVPRSCFPLPTVFTLCRDFHLRIFVFTLLDLDAPMPAECT